MISGGFVKTIVVFGYEVDVYAVDGEGLTGFIDDLPHLETHGDTMADLIYNLEVAIGVESELDAIWNERGVIENDEGDDYEN